MKADIIVKSIIFNPKLNRILLVQRSKSDDTGANTWENAGGNVECGETRTSFRSLRRRLRNLLQDATCSRARQGEHHQLHRKEATPQGQP